MCGYTRAHTLMQEKGHDTKSDVGASRQQLALEFRMNFDQDFG